MEKFTSHYRFILIFATIHTLFLCSCSIKKDKEDQNWLVSVLAEGNQKGTRNTSTDSGNFTLGGNITGLTGQLIVTNNATDRLPINLNGPFTFGTSYPNNSNYSVSVFTNPSGKTCAISNGFGKIDGKNVTDIIIICQ
jgi:hypothetical protein